MMYRLQTVITAIVLCLALSSCFEKKGVDGFQDLRWGMSMDEVKKSPAWSDAIETKTGDKMLDVLAKFNFKFNDEASALVARAYFLDGKLVFVSNIVGDFEPKTIMKFYNLIKRKYGDSTQGALAEYEVQALNVGVHADFRRSWEDDTIVLTSDEINGSKGTALIYRKAGIVEELQKRDKESVKGI